MNIFCDHCGNKIYSQHGNSRNCTSCLEMLNNGFTDNDVYINSECFNGHRWAVIGLSSSVEAMEEVIKMLK